MDRRLEQDQPQESDSVPTRRFRKLTDEQNAIYPMLAPAAATTIDAGDVFDEQILAGLVNI